MDTTCSDITTLHDFGQYLSGIHDLTGIQYFDSLTALDQTDGQLNYIPALPPNLFTLNVSGNPIASLPDLPANLNMLFVGNSVMTTLPALPSTLTLLDCSFSRFISLPTLPAGLLDLRCQYGKLTSLPSLPASLTSLNCISNAITSLPPLPGGLKYLLCEFDSLSVLPALGPSLLELRCGNEQLSSLPALPDSLRILSCIGGSFTSVPALPKSLFQLDILLTPITSLPTLPEGLYSLSVTDNKLTNLPVIPRSLKEFYCDRNELTSLPEMPDTMYNLYCRGNPYLRCLPQLKYIETLDFSNTGITCLPNYGHVDNSTPPLNTLPLCDLFNANSCQVYWNISGNVYFDSSSNCSQQTGSDAVPNVKVKLLQNGNVLKQQYTNSSGGYSFDTDLGNYVITVDTANLPLDIVCPSSRFDSVGVTLADSIASDNNFILKCKQGFDVGANNVNTWSTIWPGGITEVSIAAGTISGVLGQTCNTTNLGGELVITLSGPASYVSPASNSFTPAVSGNTLTYTLSDWSTVVSGAFDFIIQVDTTAQAGQQICFDATVTPTIGDNNPTNNHLTYCVEVVNSFDPNDKSVYPVSDVDITGDHWLTYTVRFQNTGNAPARNIYITDTIDTDVDIETFQLLAYSFQSQVIIKGNAVRFNFANINLPDSVNDEPNSHGYVQYKVKVKGNAAVGTVINNTAFIYFDFNAPVVTNTTTNTLALPNGFNTVSSNTATMQLYPNPATDMVMINLSDNLTGGSLTLSDVTGRSLNTINITANHSQLNTGALASGVYLVTAVKGGVRVVQRLVVSR